MSPAAIENVLTQQEKYTIRKGIRNSEINPEGFTFWIPNLFWMRIFGSMLRKPCVHY